MNPARTFWPKQELLSALPKAEGIAKKIMWRLIRGQDHYEVGKLFEMTADEVIRIVYKVINDEECPNINQRKFVPSMEEVTMNRRAKKKPISIDDQARVMVLSVQGYKPREISKLTNIPKPEVYRLRSLIRHGKR